MPRDRAQSSRPTTIRDIASAAGVSIATVSRALNGHHDIAPATKERVRRIAREQGYSANRSARGLSGGRSGLIGLTLPTIFPTYFSSIVAAAADALAAEDIRIVLCPTQHQHDREVSLIERLLHGMTEGGILVLPEESDRELRHLRDTGYAFVVVDPRTRPSELIPTVSSAHATGASQAVSHLIELGHRRIGAITGPRAVLATAERLRGYYASLAGVGVLPVPRLIIESNFETDGGRAAAGALLSRTDPPTAIFAFNDQLAIGAMQAARSLGLRVPEDVSIVGFDDTVEAEYVTPGLTTIRQPLAEMGRMAVGMLLRLIRGQVQESLHVELATRLVVRGSTAPPPGA